MEEKILIKSDRYNIGKILCIIAISVAIVCVLIGVVRYKIFIADYELCDVTVFVESPYVESHYKVYPQKCNESEWYDKCYEHQYTENYDALKSATEYAEWHVKWTARIGCIAVVGVSLLCTFIYFWLRSYEMVVTDKRVYGKAAFGKRVDLPVDSVSAIGSKWPKGIAVATSSGKIAFLMIKNRDAIHKCVSDLLIERQSKPVVASATAPVPKQEAPVSNADELKKYKELLDMGAITQEEFDAKKKQLLGL